MTKIETTFDNDTVWLFIDQMAELFQRDRSVLSLLKCRLEEKFQLYMSDWIEILDGSLKLSKHEILTHAGKISANTAELKAKEEYKKYKYLHIEDISQVEKDYIDA